MEITQQARDIAADAMAGPKGWPDHLRNGQRDDAPIIVAAQRALDAPRTPMTDDEILQRARRAVAKAYPALSSEVGAILRGDWDTGNVMRPVLAALRDLNTPPVNPYILVCREYLARAHESIGTTPQRLHAQRVRDGKHDDEPEMQALLALHRNPGLAVMGGEADAGTCPTAFDAGQQA